MHDLLLIIGAGGHGKVVGDIALELGLWKEVAFLDDDASRGSVLGLPVLGDLETASRYREEADFFVAIGDNSVRQEVLEGLFAGGFSVVSLVHPNAILGLDVELGPGSVVMAGAVINPSTRVGRGCIVNTGASLDHDNVLGEYVHVSPGARTGGTVSVGKGSWLGMGAVIRNNVVLSPGCIIGAGSVVLKDIPEPGTYVGAPARKVKG